MDLLTALQANTAALKELTAAVQAITPAVQDGTVPNVEVVDRPEPIGPLPADRPEPIELDYEVDVKPAAQAYIVKHGREAFVALLKCFGVTKAAELRVEQYGAFVHELCFEMML